MFDVHEVAAAIGLPVENWHGKCYAIACQMVMVGLTDAEPVYGSWSGPIHPDSHFGKRQGGDVNHGWLVADKPRWNSVGVQPKSIIDPTRWVFENVEPYIYVGPNDYYDRASDARRMMMHAMRPIPEPEKREVHLDLGDVEEIIEHVNQLLDDDTYCCDYDFKQVFYLANCPVSVLRPFAKEILSAISEAGHNGLIPVDVRQWVLEEPPAGFKTWPYVKEERDVSLEAQSKRLITVRP